MDYYIVTKFTNPQILVKSYSQKCSTHNKRFDPDKSWFWQRHVILKLWKFYTDMHRRERNKTPCTTYWLEFRDETMIVNKLLYLVLNPSYMLKTVCRKIHLIQAETSLTKSSIRNNLTKKSYKMFGDRTFVRFFCKIISPDSELL